MRPRNINDFVKCIINGSSMLFVDPKGSNTVFVKAKINIKEPQKASIKNTIETSGSTLLNFNAFTTV
ncbi:hypothetical protein B9Q09_00675 [Candidatus Marsarchaeota G2 archaeon ECH_B_SAG-C16]|jgi:hypothetical protein|uniref:Uncharacterized protein n=2 Tax=Candidatus Marsarchaeota group 2 TaxID=2203771 RepID=A0A2R6CD36_9ARCH|nr:MAG: hypothetical protein B9Q09_00675 [Candidatus Marsarchaeota G2 archaeon ECH_B_SAG-C16]PSO08804.1 MAG: hypothetical protein B9Q04_03710 [Candidatus Marsarchaeota G2 archaeon BE_D]